MPSVLSLLPYYFLHATHSLLFTDDRLSVSVFAEDADVAPSLSGEAYDAEEVVAQWALPWSPSQSLVDANASINASAVVGSLECDWYHLHVLSFSSREVLLSFCSPLACR